MRGDTCGATSVNADDILPLHGLAGQDYLGIFAMAKNQLVLHLARPEIL